MEKIRITLKKVFESCGVKIRRLLSILFFYELPNNKLLEVFHSYSQYYSQFTPERLTVFVIITNFVRK